MTKIQIEVLLAGAEIGGIKLPEAGGATMVEVPLHRPKFSKPLVT